MTLTNNYIIIYKKKKLPNTGYSMVAEEGLVHSNNCVSSFHPLEDLVTPPGCLRNRSIEMTLVAEGTMEVVSEAIHACPSSVFLSFLFNAAQATSDVTSTRLTRLTDAWLAS